MTQNQALTIADDAIVSRSQPLATLCRPASAITWLRRALVLAAQQTSSRSPSTLRGVLGRPPPLPLSSLSIAVSACGVVDRLLIFGESHLPLPTRAKKRTSSPFAP
jgi:hypothetical protein